MRRPLGLLKSEPSSKMMVQISQTWDYLVLNVLSNPKKSPNLVVLPIKNWKNNQPNNSIKTL